MGISVLDAKNKPEAFKARNFVGVSLMNKGKLKDAQKQFDSLMRQAA